MIYRIITVHETFNQDYREYEGYLRFLESRYTGSLSEYMQWDLQMELFPAEEPREEPEGPMIGPFRTQSPAQVQAAMERAMARSILNVPFERIMATAVMREYQARPVPRNIPIEEVCRVEYVRHPGTAQEVRSVYFANDHHRSVVSIEEAELPPGVRAREF